MSTLDKQRWPEKRATDLASVSRNFDPTLAVDPSTHFYVERTDHRLQQLVYTLEETDEPCHAFLCGHGGSGKTTELKRLSALDSINEKYLPVYLTVQSFGTDPVHLTHDALLVEIGLKLAEEGKKHGADERFREELDKWGMQVVRTFLGDQEASLEGGARGSAWLAFFKASLKSRRRWSVEQTQRMEPKITELLAIVNRMATDLGNKAGKRVMVILDDLEKGDSDSHQEMHHRLFHEYYETLVQPRFSVVYTLPIYFRALPSNRIPNEQLYAFSAIRIYQQCAKNEDKPVLQSGGDGYKIMREFIQRRVEDWTALFDSKKVLDELILIGGGLFRETARAVRDAAYFARTAGEEKILMAHAREVFDQVKKEFQPQIRGKAVEVLRAVRDSDSGWVEDVEPYLQSRAVVEYENGDLWLDLRYVLKDYVAKLGRAR